MYKVYLLFPLILVACSQKKEDEMNVKNKYPEDVHSYARPNEVVMTHLDLDLDVNFEKKILAGEARIEYKASENAKYLILDTKDLKISSIWDQFGDEAQFTLGEEDKILGSELKIEILPNSDHLTIYYENDPSAEALQWLDPQQTADKKSPFLYTQSQAILARTWIPLQDSPGIRFTYSARVKVPEGMMALMSAENPQQKNENGIYEFNMVQPIPAYLMALAAGNMEFQSMSSRTGVYAEPTMMAKSAYELSDTEEMIKIAESLYGPYRWERYDIIVLPPSFPFGGMENPRLTFATPTIIAGDKSLVSLIAHELAHSWSGNLVTNATWNDFWINEGFTVYFELRIMEELYGRDYSEMLASLNQQDLKTEVQNFIDEGKAADTRLKLDLTGRNPDDGVTSVPYDKGYSFLRYVEELVGREKFDPFLKEYFDSHAFQTMTTEGFLAYMKENLFDKNNMDYPASEVEKWVYEPGIPESLPQIQSIRFQNVDRQLEAWTAGMDPVQLNTNDWSTHEWLHFIKNIPLNLDKNKFARLDQVFRFTDSNNAEILEVWFKKAIQFDYEKAYPAMEEFLIHTGRRKFLIPLYTEMIKHDETRELAQSIYKKARPNYHFVSVSTIDELLKWNK